jgi:hypothetical protein
MSLLPSRYVTAHIAGIGDLPAVIEAEDEYGVVLALAVDPPAGLDRALHHPVHIECVAPRGVHRVTGVGGWDAARPDELRVAPRTSAVVQRRRAPRVDADVPALLVVVEGDSGRVATTTVNLSAAGLLVRDAVDVAPGTHVRVDLEIEAGAAPLTVEGRVVRKGRRGEQGIEFDTVSRDGRKRLARFIAARRLVLGGRGIG